MNTKFNKLTDQEIETAKKILLDFLEPVNGIAEIDKNPMIHNCFYREGYSAPVEWEEYFYNFHIKIDDEEINEFMEFPEDVNYLERIWLVAYGVFTELGSDFKTPLAKNLWENKKEIMSKYEN